MEGRFPSSVIELSQGALNRNVRFLRARTDNNSRFCSVIKGNAYGHGISTFVPMAEKAGVRDFAVFSADEAYAAMKARRRRTSHVMIMGDVEGEALAWAIEHGVSFFVFNRDRLNRAMEFSQVIRRPAKVHLELETGLNRTGLEDEEIPYAAEMIQKHPELLDLQAVCTHYAGAESVANYLRVQNQIARFDDVSSELQSLGLEIPMRHTACSAAALRYPETIMDMVRFGIAQYGFWPNRETRMDWVIKEHATDTAHLRDPLRRVLKWKSRILSIKDVPAGQFVGYGTTYQTTRKQRIATVPVGYFHGFTRQLSNLGHVLVDGRRCQVVGVVNMNLIQVDVTDARRVRIGDEVVLLGRQKKAEISVGSFSDLTPFLNYEVLVRLPSEIPRIVVR